MVISEIIWKQQFVEKLGSKHRVSIEEAGEFWDSHSTSEYEEYLEPADVKIDIQHRRFEIEIDRETFLALNAYAKKANISVKNLASSIIKEGIAAS